MRTRNKSERDPQRLDGTMGLSGILLNDDRDAFCHDQAS